jgi:hypothetical protein
MDVRNLVAVGVLVIGSFAIIRASTAFRQGKIDRTYAMGAILIGAMFVVGSSAIIFRVVWLQIICGLGIAVGSIMQVLAGKRSRQRHIP